ncbi:DUF4312 family protein [Shouchella patagoniensis]|uniref:DUF4312 family protein n=1 Tax=Shouchella patagoniensis TaxID=228576 RepID=UPI000994AD9B|nr:DUF4312 family protein [Shouchella patagoniensis]
MVEQGNKHVDVSGKGSSKEEAISHALSKIQRQVFKGNNQLLLRMEPQSVEVLKAETLTYTERFLFLFMPRKKVVYHITLRVGVATKSFNQELIQWNEKTTP